MRELAAAGVPHWVIRREVEIGRWQQPGRLTVVVHNGPLDAVVLREIAVREVERRAAIDGVTALQHAGCDLDDETVHVIVPRGSTPAAVRGVRVHESRMYRDDDILTNGIRRTKPAVAAVHAALWAVSDKQAAYFPVLVAQRRLARPVDLLQAVQGVRRGKRLPLLKGLVVEIAGGVQSLGELDVARDARRHGLPEPRRQAVRRRPSGTEYLDVEFEEYAVSLEIDGAGHDEPWQRLQDLLRDLATAAEGKVAVRIPLVAYRLDRDAVLDALATLLISRGWARQAA